MLTTLQLHCHVKPRTINKEPRVLETKADLRNAADDAEFYAPLLSPMWYGAYGSTTAMPDARLEQHVLNVTA